MLSLESSAKAASVALTRDGRLLAQYFHDSGLTHSRTLLKMAEDILRNNDLAVADIARVAVARGPGSFTGIRIGVASAKGFAWGADIPVRAVSTLRAAASVFADLGSGVVIFPTESPRPANDGVICPNAIHRGTNDVVICPAMDARRGEVYNALFEIGIGGITRLVPDRALTADSLAEEAARSGKTYLLTGDGAHVCVTAFDARGVKYRLAPALLRLQCAYGVALAAENAPDLTVAELTPNYLRASQAERLFGPPGEGGGA
jgi:tRNA threonylcarbamoyladenosine biosynthesis protein TsaB